jgi:hypothetical protein
MKKTKEEIEKQYQENVQNIKYNCKKEIHFALQWKRFLLCTSAYKAKTLKELLDSDDKLQQKRAETYFNLISKEEQIEVFNCMIGKQKIIDYYIQESIPFFLHNLSTGSKQYSIVVAYKNKINIYLIRGLSEKPSEETVLKYFNNYFKKSNSFKLQNIHK